jgi:hypothetical protein
VRAAYRRVAAAARRAAAAPAVARPDEDAQRAAATRAVAGQDETVVLVEAMTAPGVELVVAARGDAVVPALVVGLGGVWTELLDDVAIVPLPATLARVEAALRSLRGAGLLIGERGSAPIDIGAICALAVATGDLLRAERLSLLELNPVIASASGVVAVDAVARR